MIVRIGRVSAIFGGKVQVNYEDLDSTSEVPMLTFNNEYSMPNVGDLVLTLHRENGSSKGYCLGTFYGISNTPDTEADYYKDLKNGAYLKNISGELTISGDDITLSCTSGDLNLKELIEKLADFETRISTLEG